MKNTLVHAETTSALTEITNWGQRQIELLKTQIAPGCSDDELIFFGQVCSRTKLDPFRKQIYAIPRYDGSLNGGKGGYKMSIQTGIDGLRAIASRTGQYAGSDEPLFDEGLNLYQHKETGRKRPTVAKVTVWKIVQGQRCGFTGIAMWDEFVQTTKGGQPNALWNRMPYNQLAKCAESQALRKAFPEEVADISLGEPQDDFGGDRTPVDYLESETWLKFTDAIQRAEMDNDSIGKLQVLEDWIYRQVQKGKLPKIAENSIERELKTARERINGRIGMPKGKAPVTQAASEAMPQSTEDQEIIDYLKTVPVATTEVQTPLLEDDQW